MRIKLQDAKHFNEIRKSLFERKEVKLTITGLITSLISHRYDCNARQQEVEFEFSPRTFKISQLKNNKGIPRDGDSVPMVE